MIMLWPRSGTIPCRVVLFFTVILPLYMIETSNAVHFWIFFFILLEKKDKVRVRFLYEGSEELPTFISQIVSH